MNQLTRPLNEDTILQLFNLTVEQVENIDIEARKSQLYIAIKLAKKEHQCPVCQNTTTKIKGYSTKKILHAVITHMPCFIIYKARRYECTVCKKTFNEHNPFAYRNMKISSLTVSNILEDLRSPTETFSTVSKRYGLSPTTVSTVFDSHVSVPRRQLPKYLCIDEVNAFHSFKGDYACVLVDALNGTVIDIIQSRRKREILSYFRQIPLEERKNVEMVISDMWETYRTVTKEVFPNAICSLDQFHVIQDFNRKFSKKRAQIMNEVKPPSKWKETKKTDKALYQKYYKQDQIYYLLKKWHWLLTVNFHKTITVNGKEMRLLDSGVPKKKNKKIGRYLNYHDILHMILDFSKEINDIYDLRLDLEDFYRDDNKNTARARLNDLIETIGNSSVEEFNKFSVNVLSKWKNEIINSFNKVEKNVWDRDEITKKRSFGPKKVRLSNGIIESRNRIIKQIKNASSGYGNWERFRNRVLYTINDDSTYRIIPIDLPTTQKGETQ